MIDGKRSEDMSSDHQIVDLRIELARITERLAGAEMAVRLSKDDLIRWEHSANEWRKTINDERVSFVTRAELIAAIGLVTSIALLAMRFIK